MSSSRLPAAPEAEISVLGAMMLEEHAVITALDQLRPEDFTVAEYQVLFEAMEDTYRRGEVCDPPTILDRLHSGQKLNGRAGTLVAETIDAVPTAANVAYHIGQVRDRATRRRLHEAAIAIAQESASPELPALDALLDRAERRVFDVAKDAGTSGGPTKIRGLIYDAISTIEKGGPKGLPTGFADLDRKLKGHGTHGGQLIIVAGRPGMGKSVLGTQMALHAAVEQQVPTAFFSLEMTKDELTLRALAAEGSISLERMMDGQTDPDELARIEVASRRLYPAPLWIDDTPSQTVLQLRAKSRRMKAEHDIGLIVIDYLQYVVAEAENRVQEVGKITRGLKSLAKELGVPIVALCQLSRAPEQRGDKRPVLSDLRESGDIEQDADVVILLYRPEYYFGPTDEKNRDIAGKAEAIVAKQRNGPTGIVELYFRADAVRFEDVAHWGVK